MQIKLHQMMIKNNPSQIKLNITNFYRYPTVKLKLNLKSRMII